MDEQPLGAVVLNPLLHNTPIQAIPDQRLPAGVLPLRKCAVVRVMLAASAVYGALVISPWLAALPAAAMLVPLDRGDVVGTWNRVRALLGVAFLAALVWVAWTGSTQGVLVQVSRAMVLG